MTSREKMPLLVEAALVKAVATVLGMEQHRVNPGESLSGYGFDSITLTQLANQLNRTFPFVRLDASTFLEHTTLAALQAHLQTRYQNDFAVCFGLAQGEPQTASCLKTAAAHTQPEPAQHAADQTQAVEPSTGDGISGSLLLDAFDAEDDEVTPLDLPQPTQGVADSKARGIAIIGMAGRFPDAENIVELWENLFLGKSALKEVPGDRWDWQAIYGDPQALGNLTDCRYGGFLDQPDRFDSLFFGISPLEAAQMDPQQKLVLQSVWETVENAGYSVDRLKGEDIGVYLGVQRSENLLRLMKDGRDFGPYTNIGNTHSMLANRVSYFFDWKGDSLSVDTACAASSSALHLAYHALLRGEIQYALVGGVTVVQDAFSHIANRKMGLLTNQQRVCSFDENSDGYLIGEGVATALLKPLAQAEQDGDYIYGVIKGCVVAQSGKTMFLTAPDPKSHIKAVRSALREAGLQPSDIDYLEGQGTGTDLSDRTELKAYAEVFRSGGNGRRRKLGIGSTKGNIGHVESASGITSLIKVCLAMKNGLIPPVLNFQKLNWPEAEEDLPFQVVALRQAWGRLADEHGKPVPRRAGIHNFGYGGLCAHFIIEEHANACEQQTWQAGVVAQEELLVFSSKSQLQLEQYLARLLRYIQAGECHYFGIQCLELGDVAYTLQTGRQAMDVRLAVVASSMEELVAKLQRYLGGDREIPRLFAGQAAYGTGSVGGETLRAESYQGLALDAVAERWVSGGDLAGHAGAIAHRGRRIPLPGFCFASALQTDAEAVVSSMEPRLNPLVWQRFSGAFQSLEAMAQDRLLDCFQTWGVCRVPGEELEPGRLGASLGIAPQYGRLFAVLLDILARVGVLRKGAGGHYRVVRAERVDHAELERKRGEFLCEFPELEAQIGLTWQCLDNLHDILTGKIPATSILFPDGSMLCAQGFYRGNPVADHFNKLVNWQLLVAVQALAQRRQPDETLRILEIGAGTGGTTTGALKSIAGFGDRISYVYSDISAGFTQFGKSKFGAEYPFVQFQTLNIEKDIAAQGFAGHSFDVIVACNVLHATADMRRTVQNTRRLLKADGSMILNEATRAQDFISLTFGLLHGWWAFEDEAGRLPGGPLLDSALWTALLEGQGFASVKIYGQSGPDGEDTGHNVVVASSQNQAADAKPARQSRTAQPTPQAVAAQARPGADIVRQVREIFAKVLMIDAKQMDADAPHVDFGVDSFTSLQIVTEINRVLGVRLRNTELFNFPSINAVSLHIQRHMAAIAPELQTAARHNAAPLPRPADNPKPSAADSSSVAALDSRARIAIIGMSGCFPRAGNIDEYWQNLAAGRDCVATVPPGRWEGTSFLGGFLDDIDRFDPLFFKLSPKEAEWMDPQQRLFIQEAWRTFEHAGYSSESLKGSRCGVFVGCREGDYLRPFAHLGTSAHQGTGNSSAMLSARIAYFLDLKGPSLAVDTACSSALVAVHLACESIRGGTCDFALAGGVSLMCTPESHLVLGKSGMLSPDGRCKTFDDRADGFVPAEAVGAVLLKPLEDALRDGDHIFGVIQAHGINQDGKTNGITASSSPSQSALQQETYRRYQIDPERIGYVEAHGTGTRLGDPIEIDALTDSFQAFTQRKQFCAIGSVKTNIGHALAAAGFAGLIKVLLALKHKQLPPSLHFESENRHFQLAQTPFYVNTVLQDWANPSGQPRQAAISAFGFSGTNAHCVIEEAPQRPSALEDAEGQPCLIALSAKNQADLTAKIQALTNWLERDADSYALSDIAATLMLGRSHFDFRVALVASDKRALAADLNNLLTRTGGLGQKIKAEPERSPALWQFGKRLLAELRSGLTDAAESNETLLSLADLYQQGYNLEWRLLYQDAGTPLAAFRKVPLPTYPFVGGRYWLAAAGVASVEAEPVFTLADFPEEPPTLRVFQQAYAGVTGFCALLLASALQEMDVFKARGGRYSLEELRTALQIDRKYHRLLDAFLNLLLEANYLRRQGSYFERIDHDAQAWQVPFDELQRKTDQMAAEYPQIAAFLNLLWVCVRNYPQVLRGKLNATEVMFPGSSFDLVKGIYKENATADFYNRILADNLIKQVRTLALHWPLERQIKLLEIGAGTGGASALLLDKLKEFGGRISYLYTDVSAGFIQYGRRTYGEEYPFARFEVLDIEKAIPPTCVYRQSFDIIVASNVLHATRELGNTLGNVKALLKDGGYLFLNEATDVQAFATMTYGLLEGWWRFEDAIRLENSPLLDAARWVALLEQNGFDVAPPQGLAGELKGPGQHILIARHKPPEKQAKPPAWQPTVEPIRQTWPSPSPLRRKIQQHVTATILHILGLQDQALVMEKPFSDYGLDSISGIDFLNAINRQLGIDVSVTALFDYPNIAELSNFIHDHYRERLAQMGFDQAGDILPLAEGDPVRLASQPDFQAGASSATLNADQGKGRADDIAIIGMSGRFPGARNAHAFWDGLASGSCAIGEPPADRWPTGSFPTAYRAGFIDGIDQFDALFFNWTGTEAEQADPQQRLFLEESYAALEDAGYPPVQLRQLKCGVFAGVGMSDYLINMRENGYAGEAQTFWGNSPAVVPARISYFLNLKGPSIAIDTACSSSLVAIHAARQSILAGECDMALAGGVFLCTTPHFHTLASKAQMLAADGKCKAFDQKADGFVFGEGVGVIVLKRLDAALRDKDHIHAVLKASAVNQDGKTNGIAAPSALSQTELEVSVYEQAGINPETIGYVEAHGTGTKLGDPVEVEALSNAFRRYTDKKQFCLLGSVKPNIGHASLAAGIASVIKVLQCFAHREIPPLLNFSEANEHIDFVNTPFRVNTGLCDWASSEGQPRRAAISGFGLGGTNAHLVLEESPVHLGSKPSWEEAPALICLSAKTEHSLRQKARDLAACLDRQGELYSLGHIAYTLHVGREHFPHRAAWVAQSRHDLLQQLRLAESGTASQAGPAPLGTVGQWMAQLRTGKLPLPDAMEKLHALATLYRDGQDIDWQAMYASDERYRVPLPGYPFDRSRFWFQSAQQQQPRQATPANPAPSPDEVGRTWWQPHWNASPLPRGPSRQADGPLLVFGARQYDLSHWQGGPIVLVTAGDSFAESLQGLVPGATAMVQIRAGEPDDYQRLAGLLAQRKLLPARILHTWSEQPFQPNALDAHLDRGFYTILFMAQALMKQTARPESIHLIYAFVPTASRSHALNQAMGGLAKTLNQESPAFLCQTLEVPHTSLLAQLAGMEYQYAAAGELEVRYQQHADDGLVREVKVWQAVGLDNTHAQPLALKEQGTYLLIGGAGGLGLLFCQYLQQQAEKQKSRISVFLTGRKPLPAERLRQIGRMDSPWCKINYLQADIADLHEARQIVAQARGKQGGIAGVFHFAGATRDAFLLKKTKAECQEVLAAKVQGTLALEQALQGEKVDFLTFFSSASAAFGNVGQADYAYANAFLDALAVQGSIADSHTFSVNWAFWQEGGMRPADSKLDTMASAMGVRGLASETGLQAWETILQAQLKQCMFLSGDPQTIKRFVEAQRARAQPVVQSVGPRRIDIQQIYREAEAVGQIGGVEDKDATVTLTTPNGVNSAALVSHPSHEIEAFLAKAVADITRLPPDKISIHRPLEEFGLDSLMVTALNQVLIARFGPLPATLFFEYHTLEALAGHLAGRQNAKQPTAAHLVGRDGQPVAEGKPSLAGDIYSRAETIGLAEAQTAAHRAEAPASAALPQAIAPAKACPTAAEPCRDSLADRQRHMAGDDPFDIAIIGVSGIYPQADTLDAFWDNLKAGRDCVVEVPKWRWNVDEYYDPDRNKAMQGKIYCKWGGFVDDVDGFDAFFFNISPREAKLMDPSERLFLQTAWAACEDAGYTRKKLAETCGMNVGVFAGISSYAYSLWGPPEWEKGNLCTPCGGLWSIANRVSYCMGLSGPSYPVDTACSSSLSAVHQACLSLKNRECAMAIAGGASFIVHPHQYVGMCQNQMLSPSGKCHSFGDQGDGFVPGEGVGAILLKPLPQALADGDPIHAIIKGSSVNHGGRTNGYAVPNPKAQAELIKLALKNAHVSPSSISYVEAHGTGTALGDPVEFEGLCQAWASDTAQPAAKQSCAIGSVKSNIGHLNAAAGISGLTKILLQMRHKTLAPSLHARNPNPNINFADSPFFIQQYVAEWSPRQIGQARRAAISSFGAGGANAHVILEEYAAPPAAQAPGPMREYVFPLSAKTPDRLVCYVEKLLAFWEGHQDSLRLQDVAYTLQTGREAMPERIAFVATQKGEVGTQLRAFLQRGGLGGAAPASFFKGRADADAAPADAARLAALASASAQAELAGLWVSGADIDWEALPCWKHTSGPRARRISLPSYPFAKTPYWYAENTASHVKPTQQTVQADDLLAQHKEGFDDLAWLGGVWLLQAFQQMGCFRYALEDYARDQLKTRVRLIDDYRQLYEALLDILKTAGYIVLEGDRVRSTARVSQKTDRHSLDYWVDKHPELAANFRLLWTCLENIVDILQGGITATDVIFPNSSMALVEKIYQENAIADYYNRLVVDEVVACVRERLTALPLREKLQVLEIGAGTGGTSAALLAALTPYQERLHYDYTDLSIKFVQYGRQHYGHHTFADFQILDIERDVKTQGFAIQQADVLVATNVLHATRILNTTLKNAKSLLRKGGKLIINEAVETHVFSTLTFGLLKGWWLAEDPHKRLPGSPLLSVPMWQGVLREEGFVSVRAAAPVIESGVSQNVLIAESDGQIAAPGPDPLHTVAMAANSPKFADVTAGKGEKQNAVAQKLRRIVAAVIELAPDAVNPDSAYVDMGVDSILAIEIISQINREFGITLRTTALFDHATINRLAAHIVARHGNAIELEDELLQVFQRLHSGELNVQAAHALLGV